MRNLQYACTLQGKSLKLMYVQVFEEVPAQ